MKLIIIEGQTSTGKSTLARRLSRDLNIKAVLKDDYKEREFDRAGKNLNFKLMRQLERQSWGKIFKAVESAVENNESLIVEGNFFKRHRAEFQKRLNKNVTVVEIFCFASGRTVLKRYVKRNRIGERHPGHHDEWFYWVVALEAFIKVTNRTRLLRLTTNLLKLDTNNFPAIDYPAIVKFIEKSS